MISRNSTLNWQHLPLSPRSEQGLLKQATGMRESRMASAFSHKKEVLQEYISRIRRYTQIKSLHSLTTPQLQAINDSASKHYVDEHNDFEFTKFEQQYYQYKTQNFTFRNLIYKLLSARKVHKLYTIKNTSHLLLVWNTLKIFAILHLFFLFPLADSIGPSIDNFVSLQDPLYIAEQTLFMLDLVIRFNTQIQHKGHLIQQRQQVISYYLKRGLIYDLLGVVGAFMFYFFRSSFLKYIFLVKIRDLSRYFKYLKRELDSELKFRHQLQLFKLLLTMAVLAHMFACMWVAAGNYHNEDNWISRRNLTDDDWEIIYLNALYFSITTMTTVGFGDISAINKYEVCVAIILVLSSSCMFAYVFNTITFIIKDLDDRKGQIKHDLQLMHNYMQKRQIDKPLQLKVQNYLQSAHKYGPSAAELKVFQKLSHQLQSELDEQDKGVLLLKQPFFVNNFSMRLIKELIESVQELNLQPGEEIRQNPGIYLVQKGAFSVSLNNEKTQIGHLKPGDMYGLLSIFTSALSRLHVKSQSFGSLYFISMQRFMEKLRDSDLEQFCYIRDKLHFGDRENLFLKCYLCRKKGHDLCEDIVFSPNRLLILQKWIHNFSQARAKFRRNRRRNSKIFENLKDKQSKAFTCATNQTMFIRSKYPSLQFQEDEESQGEPLNDVLMVLSQSYDYLEHYGYSLDENKQVIPVEYVQRKQNRPVRSESKGPSIIRLLQGLTHQKIWSDQFMICEDFDVAKPYVMYFPTHNLDSVIQAQNQKRKQKRIKAVNIFAGN